jgi:transcriptional regulator with GAF, ATPase, and Fis domain
MTGDHREEPSTADAGGQDGHDDLALLFSNLARSLQQQPDPEATLEEVVRAAVELIPGCDEASISVVTGRRQASSRAASGGLPRAVDELQEALGEGPCLDAAYEHESVCVPDMATETRWPRFTAAALEAGATGMLSLQLYVEDDNLGALNLYSRTAGAFDEESEHVGLMLAAHAAVAFAAIRKQTRLNRTVATRQLIGMAQGILIERHKLTADQAFGLLVRVSQHSNKKLRDVADELVQSGRLDDTTASGR